MAKSRRNNSLFKKSLIIYSLIAAVLVVVFLIYIFLTLKSYEKGQTTNVIKDTILSLDDSTLKEYLKDNKQSEDLLDEYKKQINDKDVKIVKKDKDNYEVILNNRVLFEITTKYISTETKLGIFSYEKREITSIEPNLERGLIFYDVTIPSTYKLYVNNKLVEEPTTKEKYKNLDSAIKLSEKLNIPSIIITQEYFKDMPYVNELRELAKKSNTNLFINVPFNFPQYIIKHYPQKIILLIPSKKEIAGLVINEIRKINKSNILIVANNIDGLNEQIEDTKDGILVNMDNLEESALKIKKYFNSKDIIRINNNSLATLENKYDFEMICNNFLKKLIGDMYE